MRRGRGEARRRDPSGRNWCSDSGRFWYENRGIPRRGLHFCAPSRVAFRSREEFPGQRIAQFEGDPRLVASPRDTSVFVPRFALGAVLFQIRTPFRFGRATCPSERSLFLFITGSDPLWLSRCNSSYALQSRCSLEYPDKLISLVVRSSFRIAHLRKDTSLASGLYKSACRSVGDGETVGDICGVHDRLFDEKLG